MAQAIALPDDFQPNGVGPTETPPAVQQLPDDFVPNGVAPESVTVTGDRPETGGQQLGDLASNVATGVARIPGAIIGTPHSIAHAANWIYAQLGNAWNGIKPDGTWRQGADYDESDPLTKHTLSPEDVDKGVFKGISAIAGKDVQPYDPSSFVGKLLQAATTGAGVGLVDPAALAGVLKSGATGVQALTGALEGAGGRAAKMALASGAANAADQAAPDNPALGAIAAMIAHAGASGVGAAASAGKGVVTDATRQVFSPSVQGEREAARVLQRADNSGPGLANPSATDLAAGQGGVKAATDDIGSGLPDYMAGASLRSGLQARADALKAQRSAATDAAYDAFRAQPALPATALEPFMRSPSFRKALGAANGAVLDEGGEPITKYFDLGADDMPTHLTGEAIPPDVLHRVKSQLGDVVKGAPAGSQAERTATMLNKRFGAFLDDQYPASGDFPGYAAIRNDYATASRPLDPFAYGPVDKALDAEKQFGKSRYVMPDERLPDTFLRSNATRADLDQLIAAHGGDKAAALGSLQDHLAAVAQRAVQPNGTLDTAAFDKEVQPYRKAMGWFPDLNKKFANAKAAQGTLDTMNAQRSIADAVAGGALRDGDGAITGTSFAKWFRSNKGDLDRTQNPGAVMRLQSIGQALQGAVPGELADALKSELLPTAVGTATAGLEGGVLATLLHRSAKTAFGGLDAKRQAAFAAAIENAVTDPAYAQRLAATAAQRGRGLSPVRALVRAVAATPLAVNAGNGSGASGF